MLFGARLCWAALLVQLQCRRRWLDVAVLCCSTFACCDAAMLTQQQINGCGRARSREVLEAVLMHGFVGPCIKAAVRPRQHAARRDLTRFFARAVGRGRVTVRMQQEASLFDRYGSFYTCASSALFGSLG